MLGVTWPSDMSEMSCYKYNRIEMSNSIEMNNSI